MSTCATCDHGQHLRSRTRSLGFVACDLGEKWRFAAGTTPCTRGKWKRRERIEEPEQVAAPVAADEERWWNAT